MTAPVVGRRPRVLAVATFLPWPQNHGDALRRLMLLEALADVAELTALCVHREDSTPADVQALRLRLPGSRVEDFPLWQPELNTRRAKLERVGLGAVTGTPPWVFRQWSRDLAEALPGEALREDYDVVVLVGEPAGRYARFFPRSRVVWDKSNVLTSSYVDAVRTSSSLHGRVVAALSTPVSYVFERRVLGHVDDVWVTSADEAVRFRQLFRREPAGTLPSATNPRSHAPGVDLNSRTYLWMSTFGYRPNWEGLLRFLDAAAPTAADSGLRLRVVGAEATPEQQEHLRRYPFVDFLGYVPELADACEGVAAAVVPVWAGAGVKLKTLTLMGLGLPVFATPVAMEGIPHDAAVAVRSSAQGLVRALLESDLRTLASAVERADAVLAGPFSRARFLAEVARLIDDSCVSLRVATAGR